MDFKKPTDPPTPHKNYTWTDEMHKEYKNKPRTPGQVLPKGTFTKSASVIVNILKQHSKDYKQAMSKLNAYINAQGANLQGADRERLYSAKEMLRSAYGIPDKEETTANGGYSVNFTPSTHNFDDPYLDTGINELGLEEPEGNVEFERYKFTSGLKDRRCKMKLNASARLMAAQEDEREALDLAEGEDQQEMDVQEACDLEVGAASRLIKADKWSSDVSTHWTPPEGLFSKSAGDIAKGLKRGHKDLKSAMSSLNFYINRGGSKLSESAKKRLESAKNILRKLYK